MSNTNNTWSRLRGDEDFYNLGPVEKKKLISQAVAETLGTAVFVGLGCSGVIANIPGTESWVNHLTIVLGFASAIALVVTVFGHISGCHVNPAISLAAVIMEVISIPKFLLYSVCQCVGACLGVAAVKVISPAYCTATDFCVTRPNVEVGAGAATLAEGFLTAILIWVVCAAAWDRRNLDKHDSLPIKFGFAVIAIALPGAKYAGCSVNPARSLAPALISGNWDYQWVYWIGPFGGSIIASYIYKTLLSEVDPPMAVSTKEDPQDEEHPL
ncbi:aquaporin AQPAe.a-like [Macrosteles quadrilineatus]|uniref:aquaporin AQPAe.a-like n=1 Tax=Macrosteles quadrilineatus TaxID=74068 RepID=UPI0023E143BE|nr:aquaporin AQPAe.a-like [Macrosteles quadrilineatus]